MKIARPSCNDVAWIHGRRNDVRDAVELGEVQQRVDSSAFCEAAYEDAPVALFGGSQPDRAGFMHMWAIFTPAAAACGFAVVRAMLRAYYVTVPRDWPVRVYYTLQREQFCKGAKLLGTLGYVKWPALDQHRHDEFWLGYKIQL